MIKPKTPKKESRNFVYIVECSDGTLYTGWANHLEERIKAHNEGRGAKYTKSRRPVELVWYRSFPTKEEAMREEWRIKHLTREQKIVLLSEKQLQADG